MWKKVFAIIILILISLNFIPVKFAVKYNYNLKDNQYLCYMNYKDGQLHEHKYKWCTTDGSKWIKPDILPDKQLSARTFSSFKDYKRIMYDNNNYIFTGNADCIVDNGVDVIEMNTERWDIVYPIRRTSFMRYFAPVGYLTVYDFDWINILFSKN